ncbi:MAG TPA: PAS domain S-box protein, partial [Flavisolibacter sp.]|nr:PAS domain S-box protein [Flavisolibacter sp.]
SHSVRGLALLTGMRQANDYGQVSTLRHILAAGSARKSQEQALVAREIQQNDSNFLAFSQLNLDSFERLLFDRVITARNQNSLLRQRLLAVSLTGKPAEAPELRSLLDSQDQTYERYQNLTELLGHRMQEDIRQANQQLNGRLHLIHRRKYEAGLVLFACLVLLSSVTWRTVVKIRRLNQSLAESELNYRTLVENTGEIITRSDAGGRLTFANRAFYEKLQYPEIDALRLKDLLAEDLPPMYDTAPPATGSGRQVLNQSGIYRARNGEQIFVEGNVVLDYQEGRFTGASAFFRDVTERVELYQALEASEKKYRELFNFSPLPQYFVDPDTYRFLEVNNAALQDYGYSKGEFLRMTVFDLRKADGKEAEAIRAMVGETAKTGASLSTSARHYRKSGEGIDVELSVTMVDLNARRVFLVIAKNVTEKNKQEREITKAILRAQEDERYAIGTELHDNVCQIIASTQLVLDMLKPSVAGPEIQWWQRARQNTDLALEEIRTLSHRLAPVFLEDIVLQDAFDRLLQSMRTGQPFTTTLFVDPLFTALQPSPELQLHLYRMVQEQLRNIVKYADARQVTV